MTSRLLDDAKARQQKKEELELQKIDKESQLPPRRLQSSAHQKRLNTTGNNKKSRSNLSKIDLNRKTEGETERPVKGFEEMGARLETPLRTGGNIEKTKIKNDKVLKLLEDSLKDFERILVTKR